MKGQSRRFRIAVCAIVFFMAMWLNEMEVLMDVLAPCPLRVKVAVRRDTYSDSLLREKLQRDEVPLWELHQSVPQCAKGLAVGILQHNSDWNSEKVIRDTEHGGDEEVRHCYGFFLLDDTIVTSIECAESAVAAVDVSTRETQEVAPHERLSVEMLATEGVILPHSTFDLGILKVRPAEDRKSSHRSRIRMFLHRNSPSIVGKVGDLHRMNSTAFSIECQEEAPVLSAFAIKEEGIVPLSVGREAADSNTAIARTIWKSSAAPDFSLARMSDKKGGGQWWIQKENKEVLEGRIVEMCNTYRGPNGTLSVVDAAGISAVLQAEDPTGKARINCMEMYFKHWQNEQPFSGEPFFEWLDHGSGKYVDLQNCRRKKFHRLSRIKFFNESDREESAVDIEVVDGGKTVRMTFASTGNPVPKGNFEYVWGLDRRLYVARRNHLISHASFFRAKPVLMAGEMRFGSNGELRTINDFSGHYKPRRSYTNDLKLFFKNLGVKDDALLWKKNNKHYRPHKNCLPKP